ncbi:MaoC/PaaZ C-terminal domain-containing protein [Psychrobacillus antarcticus]|uniref:MaoC/PaaZ C-terminal domain-containing protein n=1 Tax=Psychrobacillus antarcticus TaxID=2879115 RepID=UPI00240834BA|nr:MaoC/PaaZ C-terminal domain-containing protein [Psychrobacillus antarcticus]
MTITRMFKTTSTLLITESHLLLPIIWEGDLNLHSNEPLMRQSQFQNIILHGDTVFSLAIALVEKQEVEFTFINEFDTIYKRSVTLGDKIFVEYNMIIIDRHRKLEFLAYKNDRELVMEGTLLTTSENEVFER